MSRSAELVRRVFEPPTKLTGSQWADRYGWIARSSGASEPGQYSTERVPYMREILDVCCDETHRDVVLNKPAQVGFTEALNQIVAFGMVEDPSGTIVIQPNLEMAKAWVKERIDPMLAESPKLKGIVRSEGGRRTSDDTMQRKVFPGGWLVAVGAQAPSALRSRPARRVLGDERSGWVVDARQQGDPWDLAVERTATFWNAKRIQGSTPGESEVCPITMALSVSDYREWHVACPSCGYEAPFQWRAADGTYRLVCDRGPADELIPQTARYLCTGCGVLIPEQEKARMNRNGRWIARQPGRAVAGFNLGNSLMSPWRTWGDVMELWVKAQGNPERLKVFVTHVLAEPWRETGERIDVHTLQERATPMPKVPVGVGALFGAIDVQKDRVESLLIGVGEGERVWVLEWSQHEGDPETPEPYDEAWAHLTSARGVRLYAIAIDTGFLTDKVWQFVDRYDGRGRVRVLGTKGADGRGRPWITKPGTIVRRSQRRPWVIGTDTAKDRLSLRLRTRSGPGSFEFSSGLDPAFYEQVTAEESKTALVKGRLQRVWRPIAGRANEGLDLTIGALGAFYAMGDAFVRGIGSLVRARAAKANADEAPAIVEPADPGDPERVFRRRAPSRRGGYVSGWNR